MGERDERAGDGGGLRDLRERVLDGDAEAVAERLASDPGPATARWPGAEVPYDGYFHGATLLHHVAGNPFIRELPATIPAVAEALLDGGAEVDAVTLAGPSQPDDIGWTALGLVATSAHARERGVQAPLLDLLLARGADPDARNGGCLVGALYYGESAAAERLAGAGARLDVVAAAGVGALDALEGFLALEPAALASAPRLAHYARVPWPEGLPPGEEAAHLRGMALVYAALHGRAGALARLLQAGVDPDHVPPFDHRGTALHWAVMGDRPEAVRLLLEAGADREARDREHGATPSEWARQLGRPRAAAALA